MKDLFCGAKVRLRAVERGDLPLIWQWQNDMEVMEHLWQRSVSQAELEREFERELAESETVTRRFIVETLAGQPAGLIWFHNMNRSNRSCTLGIYLGEKSCWGHGLGRDAIQVFLRYLFLVENMHYVGLSYVDLNRRGEKAYEQCGFVREGVSRKRCYQFGEYRDLVHMSILAEEFVGRPDTT